MVLKKGKHGLNTGASLKFSSYALRNPFSQSAIVNKEYHYHTPAHGVNASSYDVASFFDDGNISACKNMYYSLNKHSRWRLLEVLREAVDDVRLVNDDLNCPSSSLVRIVVSEKHLLPVFDYWRRPAMSNNCKSYHDSGAALTHVYPSGKYSTTFDLRNKANLCDQQTSGRLKSKRRNMRHNQHHRGIQRKAQGKEKVEEDMRQEQTWQEECEYNIYERWTVSAHPRFDHAQKGDKCWKSAKAKHFANRGYEFFHGYSRKQFSQPSLMAEVETSEDEEDDDTITDEELAPVASRVVHLTDAMFKVKRFVKGKSTVVQRTVPVDTVWSSNTASMCMKVHAKGTAVYEPQKESLSADVGSPVVVDEPRSSQAFSCDWLLETPLFFTSRVTVTSVRQESLISNFVASYEEGCSEPRRFTIDLSQLLVSEIGGGEQGNMFGAVLVFYPGAWVDGHCTSWQDNVSRYVNVQLEGDRSTKQSLFHQLHKHFGCLTKVYSICEIVNEAIDFLTAFCMNQTQPMSVCREQADIVDNASTIDGRSDECLVTYLNTLCGCQVNVYSADCHLLTQKDHHAVDDSSQKNVATLVRHDRDNVGIFCSICFELIDCDASAIPQGTALSPCQHWFCNACWKLHLVERVSRGDLSIACPGHRCETTLDRVTLLSLMPFSVYSKHRHHIATARVDRSSDWQWCPTANCGRLAHVVAPSTDSPVLDVGVSCACGATWCFRCQQVAHWPAMCSHMEKYTKLVKQMSRYCVSVYYAHVKKCPKCHQPMEKAGGCQHMVCRCGFDFCWECLSSWNDHGPYLVCPKTRASLTVVELDNANDFTISQWYFNCASQHRDASRLGNYNSISKRIIGLLNRQKIITENKRMRMYRRSPQSLSVQDIELSLRESKTFTKFISQMHQFLECTCVLLAACDHNTRNRCLELKVSLMAFQLDQMQQLLVRIRMGNIGDVFVQLRRLVTAQRTLIQRAAPDIRQVQKAMARSAMS